jgi:glutamate-5-semialdehyde dehydrogenase
MDIKNIILQMAKQAKQSSYTVASANTYDKNQALLYIANYIKEDQDKIIAANQKDLQKAKEIGLDDAMVDRLKVDKKVCDAMANSIVEIAKQDDPVGNIKNMKILPSGISVGKMKVPLGVIAIIYESRPNVTADAAALCLKSGNSVILKGGKEAINSNRVICSCIHKGLQRANLDKNIVQLIESTERIATAELLQMDKYIDIIIPRGGRNLVKMIIEKSSIPIIKHLDGICHLYIDSDADETMAIKLADNSKTRRYGVCNAMETLLIHQDIAKSFLPKIAKVFMDKRVQMRGCEKSCAIVAIDKADENDWRAEYLSATIAIKIVQDIKEAIAHINTYGSHHTDGIVTNNYQKTQKFLRLVDSSSVMVNTSTGFADGFEYGLGAEIGISTDKLHARGPVGAEDLTCQKYIVTSNGQIRP